MLNLVMNLDVVTVLIALLAATESKSHLPRGPPTETIQPAEPSGFHGLQCLYHYLLHGGVAQ